MLSIFFIFTFICFDITSFVFYFIFKVDELKDGEIYSIIMNNVDPDKCDKPLLDESNPVKRMQRVLRNDKNSELIVL